MMKLKEIRIENFGKLSSWNKNLNDGLTAVLEENGWGKSTLASFIKVMFYGFENEQTKKDAEVKNERRHFNPWQGGTYGGTIIFEAKGKEYRLTRLFGRTAKDDTFELYDNKTGLRSTDFSEKIGEELFGIDMDSFKKTMLIGQNDIETSATDSISANLGNLTDATDDINNYELVGQKFKDKLNEISSKRATGRIFRLQQEISGLEAETKRIDIDESQSDYINGRIAECRLLLEQNKAEHLKLTKEQQSASKNAELLSKKDHYHSLCKTENERANELAEAGRPFAKGLPAGTELEYWLGEADKINKTEAETQGSRLSFEEEELLRQMAPSFVAGVPSDARIKEYQEMAVRLTGDEKMLDALRFSEEETADYERLKPVFSGKNYSDGEVEELIQNWYDAKSRKSNIPAKEASLESMKEAYSESQKGGQLWLILLIAGIVLFGGGIVFAFTVDQLIGIIVGAVGLIAALAGVAVMFLAGKKKPGEEIAEKLEELEKSLADDHKFIALTEERAEEFCIRFGLPSDWNDLGRAVSWLRQEHDSYERLKEKDEDTTDDELMALISSEKTELDNFLAPYRKICGTEGSFDSRLAELRHDAGNYRNAVEKKNRYEAAVQLICGKKEPVISYIEGLGFPAGTDIYKKLSDIRMLYDNYKRAETEHEKALNEKKVFEISNNVDEIMNAVSAANIRGLEEINADIEANNLKREEISDTISAYNAEYSGLMDEIDDLRAQASALEDKRAESDELKKREVLIGKTQQLLEKAKAEFVSKYSRPVADGFRKYYELLTGENGNQFSFDANMNLKIEDHGSFKDLRLYSAGSRDKIGICFRLGLIEAMYPDEKPVIVMDDPFINLDEKRLDGGRKMLKDLGKYYQILYLTCHESRMPE